MKLERITALLFSGIMLGTASNSDASFSHKHKNPPVMTGQDFHLYQLQKEWDSLTETAMISYEEWKKAVEKPDSKEAEIVKSKVKFYDNFAEDIIELMPKKERENYDIFCRNFTLDLETIMPKNDPEIAKLVYNTAFPIILEMQIELDKVYGKSFNHKKLTQGERVLIFYHFEHQRRYLDEGGKIPDYLNIQNKSSKN